MYICVYIHIYIYIYMRPAFILIMDKEFGCSGEHMSSTYIYIYICTYVYAYNICMHTYANMYFAIQKWPISRLGVNVGEKNRKPKRILWKLPIVSFSGNQGFFVSQNVHMWHISQLSDCAKLSVNVPCTSLPSSSLELQPLLFPALWRPEDAPQLATPTFPGAVSKNGSVWNYGKAPKSGIISPVELPQLGHIPHFPTYPSTSNSHFVVALHFWPSDKLG